MDAKMLSSHEKSFILALKYKSYSSTDQKFMLHLVAFMYNWTLLVTMTTGYRQWPYEATYLLAMSTGYDWLAIGNLLPNTTSFLYRRPLAMLASTIGWLILSKSIASCITMGLQLLEGGRVTHKCTNPYLFELVRTFSFLLFLCSLVTKNKIFLLLTKWDFSYLYVITE